MISNTSWAGPSTSDLPQMTTIETYADLLSADAVRAQSARVTAHVRNGGGLFVVDDSKLSECARHVAAVTLDRYPTLDIPYHSRWRHFAVPSAVTLEERLLTHLGELDSVEAARVGFDLVVPSVLLDAGAGPSWAFSPPGSEISVGRSEGLGLASLDMFLSGDFSTDGAVRTDASALETLDVERLSRGFQVTPDNPLVGLEGRLEILRSLGRAILDRPELLHNGRPGDLVDVLLADADGAVSAPAILATVLEVLAPIWPARLVRDGMSLGDAWVYEPFGDGPEGIVPFHKLSQWLTYSLVETLVRNGIEVCDVDRLTGLPEYRNGGLLYETGVLTLRDPSLAEARHAPDSQLIVEWRALTVTLLDEVAELVRHELGRPELLLAEILEGGTWAAGRVLAFERDPSGTPPLHLDSDGTVF